jgi:hypothetical protein
MGYEPTTAEFMALLKASQITYQSVFGTVPASIKVDGHNVALDFHYLRFNANGQPKIRELVAILANHLVDYAIDTTRISPNLTTQQWATLFFEALELLRKYEESGEAGELLLYFLMKTVLKAPQMVSKISLKTNPNVEVHGSDGIHARWNETTKHVELFFGEAKIFESIYAALDSAKDSITKFHAQGLTSEIRLLTNHYKHAPTPLRDYIIAFAQGTTVPGSASLNHAILIGYDWDEYLKMEQLPALQREAALLKHYAADHDRLWSLLATRVKALNLNHVHLHVFFLPFKSIKEFRKAFHDKMFGGPDGKT